MQLLSNANGRGLRQAGHASGSVSGAGLRPDARDRAAPAQASDPTRDMTISVRLFARARDLAGCDMLRLDLPAQATVADLRRRVAESHPALRDFLPRCAIAV